MHINGKTAQFISQQYMYLSLNFADIPAMLIYIILYCFILFIIVLLEIPSFFAALLLLPLHSFKALAMAFLSISIVVERKELRRLFFSSEDDLCDSG